MPKSTSPNCDRSTPIDAAAANSPRGGRSSFASLLNTTTNCGPLVAPGDPTGSLLIGKLTGTELCTGSQMPKGDAPLAENLIDTIATWICQGADEN
jgi:hypothetical protein